MSYHYQYGQYNAYSSGINHAPSDTEADDNGVPHERQLEDGNAMQKDDANGMDDTASVQNGDVPLPDQFNGDVKMEEVPADKSDTPPESRADEGTEM